MLGKKNRMARIGGIGGNWQELAGTGIGGNWRGLARNVEKW
jgi:hypothetical protein